MKLQIKADVLRVHSDADVISPIVFRLQQWDIVEALQSTEKNGNLWDYIKAADGQIGWIAEQYNGEVLAEPVPEPTIPLGSDVYFIRHKDGLAPGIGWERRLPPYRGSSRQKIVYESIPTRYKNQVVLTDDDLEFIFAINGNDPHKMNWLLREDGSRGALLKRKGKNRTLFPRIDISGNYRRVNGEDGKWMRVSHYPDDHLPGDITDINPTTCPEWFARIYCVDNRGRIRDVPNRGIIWFPTMISFDGSDIWLPKDCLIQIKG